MNHLIQDIDRLGKWKSAEEGKPSDESKPAEKKKPADLEVEVGLKSALPTLFFLDLYS